MAHEGPGSARDQDDLDNHADQMNPNNDAYWQSRGDEGRPETWADRDSDDD